MGSVLLVDIFMILFEPTFPKIPNQKKPFSRHLTKSLYFDKVAI